MVALPFRADQPANAKLAKERGLAEVLKPRRGYPGFSHVISRIYGIEWNRMGCAIDIWDKLVITKMWDRFHGDIIWIDLGM